MTNSITQSLEDEIVMLVLDCKTLPSFKTCLSIIMDTWIKEGKVRENLIE